MSSTALSPVRHDTPGQVSSHRRSAAPYFVLVGCLALTALVTSYAERLARVEDNAQFQNAMQSAEAAIHNRTQTYIDLLVAGSAFFAGDGEVTAVEFRTFADRLNPRARYPGVLGIGFSKRLARDEKDAFVEKIRREFYPEFRLWPDEGRDEYHSIIYLEPLDRRNRAAIGYDMFTDPVPRAAMGRARDNGEPSASGQVILKQETDPSQVQAGFLMFIPVYPDGKTPATVDERRAALVGFVYSPVRIQDLLNSIFPQDSNLGVDFSVMVEGDKVAAAQVLYQSSPSGSKIRRKARYSRSHNIDIAGQPWRLDFVTNEQFERTSGRSSVPLVCLAGLVISFALFGFTHSQAKEHLAAEKHAEELRRSKAQLEESEQRFRTLADHAPVLIWIAGPDKLCQYFSKPWLDFTGRTLEQETGGGWTEGVHPDDRQRCLDTYVRSFDARVEFRMEHRLRRFDGQYRWVLDHGVPFFGAGGKFVGYIGSCVDITDRKNTEEALQRLNAELESRVAARTAALRESHEQMESFTYTVAHDLRAPLRAMQGFAAALLEDYGSALDSQAQDFMQRIMASAQRMDALIQDLLAYSRISRTPLVLEKVRLEKVVESVLSLFEAEIQTKQANVVVQAPLPEVTGHAGTIETILTNLVSNALKFVRNGSQPDVRIQAEERAESVRLWVKDNGIGIAPQYQDRIFKVFERLHGAESYPGTGIGLAIVRKGAERMGGSVGLESDSGQGSRFWIELPK